MLSLQQPEANGAEATFLLHGVFAVRDRSDGYALVEVQQGIVTTVEVDSITVTSPDGFAQSYSLPSERAAELSGTVGSRVTVMVDAEGRTMVEIGEQPVDGSDTAALVPISAQQNVSVKLDVPLQLPATPQPGSPTDQAPDSSTAAR